MTFSAVLCSDFFSYVSLACALVATLRTVWLALHKSSHQCAGSVRRLLDLLGDKYCHLCTSACIWDGHLLVFKGYSHLPSLPPPPLPNSLRCFPAPPSCGWSELRALKKPDPNAKKISTSVEDFHSAQLPPTQGSAEHASRSRNIKNRG